MVQNCSSVLIALLSSFPFSRVSLLCKKELCPLRFTEPQSLLNIVLTEEQLSYQCFKYRFKLSCFCSMLHFTLQRRRYFRCTVYCFVLHCNPRLDSLKQAISTFHIFYLICFSLNKFYFLVFWGLFGWYFSSGIFQVFGTQLKLVAHGFGGFSLKPFLANLWQSHNLRFEVSCLWRWLKEFLQFTVCWRKLLLFPGIQFCIFNRERILRDQSLY